jgi:archaetidylinositol phosphate synthase
MRGGGGFSLLDRLRGRLDGLLGVVGKRFSAVGLSPTAWTVFGLLISLLAGLAYWTGGYRGQVLGAVLVLASGWFDIVDGAVARVTGRTSKRGAFLDSTLDRVAEVAVFVGILGGGYAQPLYVLLALSLSLLVSYTRAKADSLGVSLSGVGIGERSERLLVLAIASLVGLVQWGVVVVALIAGYTFLERVYRGARSLA